MKIIELNIAEFGGLKDRVLRFDGNMNIVYGENESGKSTLVLFIKFMLYGLGRKSGKSFERERALSLDGKRAAGSMTLECGGERYLIERRAALGGRLSESCNLTNLNTGETVQGEPWAVLLGVPAEVFESSVLVSQMRSADISAAGGAIENMLMSADESIDLGRILERIDRVRKEYRLNRGEGGILYDTEKKISELSNRKNEVTKKYLEVEEMSARLARTQKSIEKTQESHAASKQMLDDVSGARIIQRFDELDEKKRELEALSSQLEKLKSDNTVGTFLPSRAHAAALMGGIDAFADREARLALREAEMRNAPKIADATRKEAEVGATLEGGIGAEVLARLKAAAKKKRGYITSGVILCVLSMLCALSGALLFGMLATYVCVSLLCVGGVVLCGAIVMLCLAAKQSKSAALEGARYGVESDMLEGYFDSCARALAECRRADAENARLLARLDGAREDLKAAHASLYSLIKKTLPDVKKDADLKALAKSEHERTDALCDRCESMSASICAAEAYVQSVERELAGYDVNALRESVKTDPKALTAEALERARTHERFDRVRLEELGKTERTLSIALEGLRAGLKESPVELSDKIAVLREKLEADTEYFDALMLAKEHLEAAGASMSKNVTPELSLEAGRLMSLVSRGAHNALQTSRTLDVSVESNGFLIGSELLSGGTRDAAYLCLRIALAKQVFSEELPPLILDEAFCQLDDARAEELLALLTELSKAMQCIILTCHKRELQICESINTPVHFIEL